MSTRDVGGVMRRVAFALFACMLMAVAHAAERRVALVIGNSAYKSAPLINPGNDARAMAEILRDSGFTVIERRNVNQIAMRRVIREFGDEIAKGGVGLFFYAGHGMQVRGRNYLIPVGHDIEREDEVAEQSVDVAVVLEKMATAKNALNILILDACRNNPFASSFRSTAGGLAPMDAPPGTLVAFATAPGQVAADGTGEHSIYTKHLLSYMREPGLRVEDVFKRVRTAVRQESGGKQTPWENTSLEADFYFKASDQRTLAAEEEERRKAQQAAIEKAVQEALQRQSKEAAKDRAQFERQIAERVAAERAAAERVAAERIAAIERAAQGAIERARQGVPRHEAATEPAQPKAVAAPPAQMGAAKPAAEPKPAAALAVAAKPVAERQAESSAPLAEAAQTGSVAPQEPVRLATAVPTTAMIATTRSAILPKVGDSWTYKVTRRDYGNVSERQVTNIVRAVTDTEIHFGTKRVSTRFDHDWNLLYSVPGDGIERKFEPRVPLFSFPLEPGKVWQGKYRMSRSDGRVFDYDMSVTAVGWEDVTVPAGRFKALKLSSVSWYRRIDSGGTAHGRIAVNRWYVSELKRFVKSETLDTGNNFIVYQDDTWELMKFRVQ